MKSNVVFRPTVVIGLGGTGFGAVLKLKKQFIDVYGSVPPVIRFLTIDTTENTEHSEKSHDGSAVMLEPTEQYVLSIANPAGLVSGANEHIDEWWPQNIPINAIIAGAGQVRARGRLALFAKSADIFGRVRQAIDYVRDRNKEAQMLQEDLSMSTTEVIDVYVVGSLAGGTGSGMFLDIAFIVRHFLPGHAANVTGVMALPRIFAGLPGVHLVKPNAYGALKEIEHFSKMDPKDRFTINYGTHHVEVQQPPFDLLYLIDSINESGRVVSEARDLLTLIAQGMFVQIGSQIGTDGKNTFDNIKTHLSTSVRPKGRSANYCSFGAASLTLPVRQFEAMGIDAARKLLSDGLLNGAFPDEEIEADVIRFIHDNGLREDDADDVINALSEREGGGQMRFPMALGQIVRYDRTAQNTIKQLHVTHRTRMEGQVAQGLETNYQKLLQSATGAINQWWERAVNRANGLMYATLFAEKLLAKLEWYQHMMENEASEEKGRAQGLNFKAVEEQIREAGGAWFRTEARVKTACENYKGLVDRECDLYVQQARREKAAELYGSLRARVGEIHHRCERIRVNLKVAASRFEQQYMDVTAARGGASPFEHTVRFDTEAHRPEIKPEEFIKWRTENFGSLLAWADVREEDVAREIALYVGDRFRPLSELPIDDVLRRANPDQLVQDLNLLARLAVPLWKYDDSRIPVINRNTINELYHYGVADTGSTVLKDAKVAGRVPRPATEPTFVSTQDPRRIILFRVKAGVPLFALEGIEDMELAYNNPDKVVSNHVHKEWEEFADVIPRGGGGEALRWFALAQAPAPLGSITRRGEWYYIRSQQARRVDGGELKLGQGRISAYQSFEKNRDLVTEVKAAVDSVTRAEGEGRVSALLREYVDGLVKQISERGVDPAIKEQVEREVEEIEQHLEQMSKLR